MTTTTMTPAALAELYTVEDIKRIVEEACEAAYKAADTFENDVMQGRWGACGFAWVNIPGIKGNTRISRMLKQAGVGRLQRTNEKFLSSTTWKSPFSKERS